MNNLVKTLIGLLVCLASSCMWDGSDMAKKESLKEYKKKRDFKKTPEPSGDRSKKKSDDQPMFVIQKHEASRLHYDFRLEIGGVLVSWAIPKGPSTNPADKRLAIQTEDHPLDYGDFEGIIPEGNYGAGNVMVWDIGTYENIKEKDGKLVPMAQCVKDGQVEVFLHGKKLQGGYALIRMKSDDPKKKQWLLVKMKDEHADARRNPTSTQNKSALTGRTMKEIEKSGDEYED